MTERMRSKDRKAGPRMVDDRWVEYERRKREWMAEHPHATREEYDRAILAIADDLGI